MKRRLPFLPTPEQELLLKAVLLDRDEAIANWTAWQSRVPLDDIDSGSQRLIPLLASRLRGFGVDHPDLPRYDSVARYFWVDNHLRVRAAKSVLSMLAGAGITAMPLKGLALAPLYYGGFALRPMSDFDIIVPTADAGVAARILVEAGWRSPYQDYLDREAYWSTRYSAQFHSPAGDEVDLHWHLMSQCTWPDADDVYWRHSRAFSLDGLAARTLSDTDHLFHTCVHGAMPNPRPPIRWVADAAKILGTGIIDWDRFIDQGRERDVVIHLQHTLPYLHDRLGLPIPASVIASLSRLKPRTLHVIEDRLQSALLPSPIAVSLQRYFHYRRNFAGRPGNLGFARYLQVAFGKDGNLAIAQWALGRLRKGWPKGPIDPIRIRND